MRYRDRHLGEPRVWVPLALLLGVIVVFAGMSGCGTETSGSTDSYGWTSNGDGTSTKCRGDVLLIRSDADGGIAAVPNSSECGSS